MGSVLLWLSVEWLQFLAHSVRTRSAGAFHQWVRTGSGVRLCSRCDQRVGGEPAPSSLLSCDEAVCREVLDV